jgi:hypothetical protein
MRYSIIAFWEKPKPVIVGDRMHLNTPRLFGEFEYLYTQVKPLWDSENLELGSQSSIVLSSAPPDTRET